MSNAVLTPVRHGHEFDEHALEKYLTSHVDGFSGPMRVRQFEGGQSNPTFQLEASSGMYVLRKQPPGVLLPSAHQVDREHRAMAALQDTDVPVPTMYVYCDDDSVIGTNFYVMEWVDGRVYNQADLPALQPDERRAIYLELPKVLASLHSHDPVELGLEHHGRPGNYFSRQISRWSKQYEASKTADIPEMDALMEWLPKNVPEPGRVVVVHGDYRAGNMLIHPTESRIVAVLDWELSTLGDGLADLGYLCHTWHTAAAHDDDGPAEADAQVVDMQRPGIPTEQEICDVYCEHAGIDKIDNWNFHIAYNIFRSAAIVQGVYKRGVDGNASSELALGYEHSARRLAERGWGLVESGS